MSAGPLEEAIEQAMTETLRKNLPGLAETFADLTGPRAYSIPEVAKRLDVSDKTIYRLIRDGRLETVPYLSPQRIAGKVLEAFLDGRRLEAVS